MDFLNVGDIAFSVLGYPVSYVELIGTLFGLISVYFASKGNILTWGTGIINETCLFILFFEIHLYPDMFLQVYFFVVTIYGWYNWKIKPVQSSATKIKTNARWAIFATSIVGSILCGFFFSNIHLYLPDYFKAPAAYPFADSFVMVSSIIANVLLARKKIENWHLWIIIDAVCVVLYLKRGVYFLALEYFVFLGLASYGLYQWKKLIIV